MSEGESVDGYRDAHEAQQLRITTLEAQLKEKAAAVDARHAEVVELERRLKRVERERRHPNWYVPALASSLITALTAGAFLTYHLYQARDRSIAFEGRVAASELARAQERQEHQRAQAAAKAAMRAAAEEAERAAAEEAARARAHGALDRDEGAGEDDASSGDDGSDGNQGTLVAIAIGGRCAFLVDGESRGTKSSIRLRVPTGPHTVTCTPPGRSSRSQRVNVKLGTPGIASFRLE
jgi:serine/threonine-protein kinase